MATKQGLNAKPLRRRDWLLVNSALALGTLAYLRPSVAQTSPAPAKPSATDAPTLLIVGDSLSAEYGLVRGTGWVPLLQTRLAQQGKAYNLVNASVSGETSSGGRSRMPALLKRHQPRVVVIELGGNDALRGFQLSVMKDNLTAMIAACKAAGAKVLLVGMQVPPNFGADYAKGFGDTFVQVAKAQQVPLVPFFLKGFADRADALNYFQSDRIHPNAKAQPMMLDNVWAQLKPLL